MTHTKTAEEKCGVIVHSRDYSLPCSNPKGNCPIHDKQGEDEDTKGGICSKCGIWKGGSYGMNRKGVQTKHKCKIEVSEWEEEFEKLFEKFEVAGGFFDAVDGYIPLKSFISQLLAKQQSDLIQRVEGMKIKYANGIVKVSEASSYNQALDDVLSLITPKV